METEFAPLRFTAGQEIATFLLSCGILSKAWEESRLASGSESFSLKEYEGVAYVAFPSFSNIEGYIVEDSGYGECNIQTGNRVFSDCLKGNADQPALVHQGALKLFLHIMQSTDFEAQLQIYTDSKQPIIFVGHSFGGAVATLATLWVLEKRLRQSSPLCITFGCPLVGDVNLDEAIGRENWGGNFCHVVSKNDIVPRMLLAPFESTAEPLRALLPYWRGNITNGGNDLAKSFIQNAYRTLLQSVRDSDTSLYKPFGTYIFFSSHGAACIADSETVLEMLRLTMQSQVTDSDEIVQNCLLEHTAYGFVLREAIHMSIIGERIVNPNSNSSLEIGILLQLKALDVEAQNENAQHALRRAAETENERNANVGWLAIYFSKSQFLMAELERYKEACENQQEETYYDSFKNQIRRTDIHADTRRIKLAIFWDDIIERVEKKQLPSDFQSQNKWINAGTAYRRLVEPLDIAHYYRTHRNGNYLSKGRPNRHKVLQKWMEDKEKARSSRSQMARRKLASLTTDSCFWAHVEEAVKDLQNLYNGRQQSLQNLREFERKVTTMVNTLSISSDVFSVGSSFMMWWQEWKEYNENKFPEWKSSSSLYDIITNESWKDTQKRYQSMEAVAKASGKPYQVFISHRGPDTKKNIASLIYHALERYGLSVFLDQYVLCPGDIIKNEIEGAISSSFVHIAIFSKNYAQSRWCLDELCSMLKSSHQPKLIPIFCDVEPWELRHIEKGCYADAFQKHRERESMEVVDEWKKALGKAADISGMVFKGKETFREDADIYGTRVSIVKESDDYGKLVKNIESTVMELVRDLSKGLQSEDFGQETASFLASSGILSKAWEESCLAINSENYRLNQYEGVSYVGFPSFHKIEDFIVQDSKYGEGNIETDSNFFSGCLTGNDDQPALVHQGALMLFLHIMENTDFQEKLQIYTDSKQQNLKPIIFVGHSLGGAVATLSTLWVLQKRLRQSSPFCITFGSPLVGDVRLVEAVGRENWGGNFCHVVSKNDIVPRVLLAPFESTSEPLNVLLLYWLAKITNERDDEPDSFIQDAYKALLQSVRKLDTSPYRPFGTYMFCSRNGAACIANSETVLEMLQLTIQSQETPSDISVQDCLLEHIQYDSVLGRVIQNSIHGGRIASSSSEYSSERNISLDLEAIGIGAKNDEALLALQKARNIGNKHNTNVAKLDIELSRKHYTMAELEWYKESCDNEDIFYYDSFKNMKGPMDARADSHRLKLARFWDEIMETWERHELPSNFQSQIKWINAGTAYRTLVEPLDIAYHYRTKDHISYLSAGERPNRYKVLQKWMEEKEKTGSPIEKLTYLSRDSCFFANLEEAFKDFENLQRGQYNRMQRLEKFERYVTRTIKEKSISPAVIARILANSTSFNHLSAGSELRVLSIKVSSSEEEREEEERRKEGRKMKEKKEEKPKIEERKEEERKKGKHI